MTFASGGGVDVVPLQTVIVVGGERVTNCGRVDVVPLLGAIAGRHFSSTLITAKLFLLFGVYAGIIFR